MNKIQKSGQIAKSVSAALLIAVVLFLSLLGASPELHKFFHPDADHADHECAITLFAHGQVDAVTVATTVSALIVLCAVIARLPETVLLPLADYRFSRSRAPPA